MDNISKVANINANLGESNSHTAYKKTEKAKIIETKENFSDIYDIRLLSAEQNRSSASFKAMMIQEAGANLNKVIGNLTEIEKSDKLLSSYPSEDIIALTKLISDKK